MEAPPTMIAGKMPADWNTDACALSPIEKASWRGPAYLVWLF